MTPIFRIAQLGLAASILTSLAACGPAPGVPAQADSPTQRGSAASFTVQKRRGHRLNERVATPPGLNEGAQTNQQGQRL